MIDSMTSNHHQIQNLFLLHFSALMCANQPVRSRWITSLNYTQQWLAATEERSSKLASGTHRKCVSLRVLSCLSCKSNPEYNNEYQNQYKYKATKSQARSTSSSQNHQLDTPNWSQSFKSKTYQICYSSRQVRVFASISTSTSASNFITFTVQTLPRESLKKFQL